MNMQFQSRSWWGLRIVLCAAALLLGGATRDLWAVQPFLVGFPNFVTADAAVDAQGFTYLVSVNGAIKKIDQSGLEIGTGDNWRGDVVRFSTFFFFFSDAATSLHVDSAHGVIYVATFFGRIYKFDLATGDPRGVWTTPVSGISLEKVVRRGDYLYACGNYYGATMDGTPYINYGANSSVVLKIPADSSSGITAARTWGYPGNNTANAMVLDDSGNVYVGGRLGTDSGERNLNGQGLLGLDFGAEGKQGYIVKWNSSLSLALDIYVPQSTANYGTYGGEVRELAYAGGFIYAVDYWTDVTDVRDVHPTGDHYERLQKGDRSMQGGQGHPDIEVHKLDTSLRLDARATVKSPADVYGVSITVDDDGNVYFLGSYGPGIAYLIGPTDRALDLASTGDYFDSPDPSRWGTISAATDSGQWMFVAKLDPGMNFQWAKTPSGQNLQFQTGRVRWNATSQRLSWVGYCNGTFTIGDQGAQLDPPLAGYNGFMVVFEPNGDITEQVKLTVFSEFGASKTQVKPFGAPGPDEVSGVNTKPVIKGSAITVSVPKVLYRDIHGVDNTEAVLGDADKIDQEAETRISSTGYSVNDNVATGDASSYTFTASEDTKVTFEWAVEHALRIKSNLDGTRGTGSLDGSTPGIPGLISPASGNPLPEVQKHWIGRNESVIAEIDGEVLDLSTYPGLPVKYVVLGYNASGPPNTLAPAVLTRSDFTAFNQIERRQQVPEFIMSGPATIEYQWELKIGIQVDTTSPLANSLARIGVTQDPGRPGQTPLQPDGASAGTYFYKEHTILHIGTREKEGLSELTGWLNGDGTVIPATGNKEQIPSSFTYPPGSTSNYLSFLIGDLVRPARVMWNYGARVLGETVDIGNYVTFSGVDDPEIKSRIRMDLPPDPVEVVLGPQGSTGADMGIWDDVAKRFLPLRPGIVRLNWKTTDADPAARIITVINIKYPSEPHFRHIANTAPVNLDPDPNDMLEFKEIKYTENGAQADQNRKFSASNSGNSVLLFNEISSSGRGGRIVTLRVRVVRTRLYDSDGPPSAAAIIGRKITSPFDTAGLGTGYLFNEKSRYNVFIHDRPNVTGPIIPVNLHPTAGKSEQLVVVWYERRDKILWPYQAAQYMPRWPTSAEGLDRIVIASRFGNESVASNGTDQVVAEATTLFVRDADGTVTDIIPVPEETTFNPTRLQQVSIYSQPDPAQAGYNPNEEHGVIAPSLRSAAVSPRPPAVYALRVGDLNVTTRNTSYTSDPYVLAQFFDSAEGEFKMKVYSVTNQDANFTLGERSYNYQFVQSMEAGEPVIPFYPLVQVIGATPCPGTYGKDGQPTRQVTYWRDHKDTAWAVSGDGFFFMYFFYPLQPDFWWPPDSAVPKQAGDCVAWLPNLPTYAGYAPTNFAINRDGSPFDYRRNDQDPPFQGVKYTTKWPENVAVLKVGETLTFPGGEYRTDNPNTVISTDDGGVRTVATEGLPGVLAWASGEVVFDLWNPTNSNFNFLSQWTARLMPVLEDRTVALPVANFPASLQPAGGRVRVKGGRFIFTELSSSLQKRIYYDPITGKLGLKGFLNDKDISDPTLTAAPPAVYVLEPNILTAQEQGALLNLQPDNSDWLNAVNALYRLSRNPSGLDLNGDDQPDLGYFVGLEPQPAREPNYAQLTALRVAALGGNLGTVLQGLGFAADVVGRIRDGLVVLVDRPVRQQAFGPGLALATNPDFLDPLKPTPAISYLTLAENNHPSLGSAPVVLHIIKVDRTQRYRGAIKTILSDNVFDENIILRHTGDFGANADDLVFEWWYRPEDGTDARPPDVEPGRWKLFADPSGRRGQGFFQLTLKGNPSAPEVLLADTLFFVRYRHKNDPHVGINWPANLYQWAGAGNSSPKDLNEDGFPDYLPQLAQGWVKRVLDAVNPYEARIREFEGDNPSTASTIMRQLGPRFEGPVALNPDKNVIENVGLIELYETIFQRARDLSIDLSTPISTSGISTALQLASTRLADFYMLLGNEAYVDALNPTIGIGSDAHDVDLSGANVGYGNLAPAVFCFQNQVSSLLEEELALLRGQDDFKARPVYNRLFWNFTKGEGEVAYAVNYSIFDVNIDGFVDEHDAMILYPQGHGDAWGHYLTALKHQYDLLIHPYFNWVSRSELYNLEDIVIAVDFLDERKFAQAAAAKAKVGTEIVNLAYRSKYVEDPDGQWQGYVDTDHRRAWGVDEWAHRAGLGAYFDWVTANALLPARHPNTNFTGIQKIDRTTVRDLATISANLVAVQTKLDEADRGANPLGLENGALTFDIDPTFLYVGSTAQIGTRAVQGLLHFDQIFERALQALKNAKVIFDYANQANNMLRQVANTEEDFRRQVFDQDLAYRNQLIEIFGTPYEGTIGSGKAYPPGYLGPDIMLYMYASVRDITAQTVPQPSGAFTNVYLQNLNGFLKIDNGWRKDFAPTFAGQQMSDFYANYLSNGGVDGFLDPSYAGGVALANINLPITAAGYTFQAPPEWGLRSSPGELQAIILQMLQAESDLAIEISNYGSWQSEILRTIQLVNARYNLNQDIRNAIIAQIAVNTTIDFVIQGLHVAAAVNEIAAELASEIADSAAEGIPKNTPTFGLAASAGDALAPVRLALKLVGPTAAGVFNANKIALNQIAEAANFFKELSDRIIELEKGDFERDFSMKEALRELQNNIVNDNTRRIAIFNKEQALREASEKYRATLGKGLRLLQERQFFNQKVAAMTQQRRYQDVALRFSRNASLEKYRSAFDLASRYVYLAATAYDYDTNLGKDDAGSPIDILADIVRQRTVGILNEDGQPASGAGGLAEDLAWLKANYDSLKFRMGLNNPQIESTTFSLRSEAFRTLDGPISDEKWRQTLRDYPIYQTNLWDVPEFRTYCRPFSSVTNGAQAGLVIPFSSQITANKNFFGWPLGGGDNAYDASVFATKIVQAGVWFANYPVADLSATPRVYLIPVGEDIMTVPTSQDLEVRIRHVLDQAIPVPFASISSHLGDSAWKPLTDSLSGPLRETKRFSSFRAAGFDHSELDSDEEAGLPLDYRLVGRSAWNTRWLLIIPGATLSADPAAGLSAFINSVTDIKLILNTYGSSGN